MIVSNGLIRVVNRTSARKAGESESDHTHRVTVREGVATDCECPDRQYRGARCKHMRFVEREIVPDLGPEFGRNINDGGVANAGDASEGEAFADVSESDIAAARRELANGMVETGDDDRRRALARVRDALDDV